MTTKTIHLQVATRLAEGDVRYTEGRRAVVEALAVADGPRSAAELDVELGADVPMSSLYRTLATLEEAAVVVPHLASRTEARYELAEWLTGHHHHLVCLECGRVEDVDISEGDEAKVDKVVEVLASAEGFLASNHALEIEGICRECA